MPTPSGTPITALITANGRETQIEIYNHGEQRFVGKPFKVVSKEVGLHSGPQKIMLRFPQYDPDTGKELFFPEYLPKLVLLILNRLLTKPDKREAGETDPTSYKTLTGPRTFVTVGVDELLQLQGIEPTHENRHDEEARIIDALNFLTYLRICNYREIIKGGEGERGLGVMLCVDAWRRNEAIKIDKHGNALQHLYNTTYSIRFTDDFMQYLDTTNYNVPLPSSFLSIDNQHPGALKIIFHMWTCDYMSGIPKCGRSVADLVNNCGLPSYANAKDHPRQKIITPFFSLLDYLKSKGILNSWAFYLNGKRHPLTEEQRQSLKYDNFITGKIVYEYGIRTPAPLLPEQADSNEDGSR